MFYLESQWSIWAQNSFLVVMSNFELSRDILNNFWILLGNLIFWSYSWRQDSGQLIAFNQNIPKVTNISQRVHSNLQQVWIINFKRSFIYETNSIFTANVRYGFWRTVSFSFDALLTAHFLFQQVFRTLRGKYCWQWNWRKWRRTKHCDASYWRRQWTTNRSGSI